MSRSNRKDMRAAGRANYMKQVRKEIRLRESIRRHAHGDPAKESAALARHSLSPHKNGPVDIGTRAERKAAQIKRKAKRKPKTP